jgi:hypothetical protein
MSEHDDELLAGLRRIFAQTYPQPESVAEFAKAALGWRDIDAELAELLSDSALETGSASLVRSGDSPRRLTFRTETLSIEVEVQVEGDRRVLIGQLAPPAALAVEAELESGDDGPSVGADDLGRFRLELAGAVRIRLRVGSVRTSWVTL